MKKSFLYIVGIATLVAGCAKDVQEVNISETGKQVITIQAIVNPETKTSVAIADGKGTYSWTENETIAVIGEGAEIPIEFTVTDVENGLFTGTVAEGQELVGAVSPASALTNVTDGAYTLSLSGTYAFEDGTNAVMVAGTPTASGENEKFVFKHAAALMKVTYANVPVGVQALRYTTDKSITGDFIFDTYTGVELTQADATGEKVAYVSLSEPVSKAGGTLEFYVPVPTGTYGSFEIALLNQAGAEVSGSVKSMNKEFVVERADIIRIPTVTLPESQDKYYVKVSNNDDLMNGTYLIVWEDETMALAFDGGLETLDAVSNNIDVEITDGKILSTEETDAAAFTISVDDGSVLSASGSYIGVNSFTNGLVASETSDFINDISIDAEGNAVIAIAFDSGNMILCYNSASNQERFRYYKNASQKPVALYLLEGSGTAIKPTAELSFPEEEYEVTLGEDFTAPVLTTNPEGLDVTYTSSNEAVATVDETGSVTLVSAGSTTITASFAGNESYRKASVSYALKVNSNVNNGDGTLENPFNIAGVYEYINNSGSEDVYVKGIISRIDDGKEFSEDYGTAVFWISDDGSEDSDQFEAYSVYFLGNRSWKNENTQIKVGDEVVLFGKVTYYEKDGIYETTNKAAYLYSLNGNAEILDVPVFEVSDSGLDVTVSWDPVENATSYVVWCGSQSYTATAAETSKTFTMPAYDSYAVYVVAKAEGFEAGVSNKETVVLSDPSVSSTTVEFTPTTNGFTSTQGEQKAIIKDATVTITSGVASTEIRIYKSHTITISVPTEKKIKQIVFTCTASGSDKYGPGCFAGLDGYVVDGTIGTWSGSLSSVTFTAASNQVRATSIKVTYE